MSAQVTGYLITNAEIGYGVTFLKFHLVKKKIIFNKLNQIHFDKRKKKLCKFIGMKEGEQKEHFLYIFLLPQALSMRMVKWALRCLLHFGTPCTPKTLNSNSVPLHSILKPACGSRFLCKANLMGQHGINSKAYVEQSLLIYTRSSGKSLFKRCMSCTPL